MGALVLDLLLIIIFLMMIPIGFFRGGLRELSTSAGLLLGILMAQQWAADWSSLLRRFFDMGEHTSTFLMGVFIAFGITGLIGYGGSAAFAYSPGPGGRLYGAYLALFNAMIATGFLINLYVVTIAADGASESVATGIVARTLGNGFGGVLLVGTIGVGIATIFGMFVRERDDSLPTYQAPQPHFPQSTVSTSTYHVQESEPPRERSEPKVIRDVQTWQGDEEPERPDPTVYGTGWRQTWPDSTPAQQRSSRSAGRSSSAQPAPRNTERRNSSKDVLADWVKDQENS